MPGCIVCASSTDVASPCCKIHVCQECLRASAAASGSLFACPNCRNKETFRRHAADQGVHLFEGLPDYVKTGAVNANDRFCCAEHCQSPYGPTYDTTSNRPTRRGAHEQSRWQLLSCLSCGSKSVHIGCSGRSLNVDLTRWRCDDCGGAPTLPAVVPQFETQEAVRPPTLTGRPPKRRRKPRDDRVGRWVEVYWAGDGEWYRGRVKSQRTRSGRLVFKIADADGETIAHALQDEACAGDVPPLLPDGAPEPWRFVDAEPPEPLGVLGEAVGASGLPDSFEAFERAEHSFFRRAHEDVCASELGTRVRDWRRAMCALHAALAPHTAHLDALRTQLRWCVVHLQRLAEQLRRADGELLGAATSGSVSGETYESAVYGRISNDGLMSTR